MKKFLLVLLLTLATITLPAQAPKSYLDEGFQQSTDLPAGWDAVSTSMFDTWTIAESGYHAPGTSAEGAYCLSYSAMGFSRDYSYVLTPAFSLDSYRDVTLSFRLKNNSACALGVYVSRDNGQTFLNEPIATELSSMNEWWQYTLPLTQYGGQTIRLAFRVVYGVTFDQSYFIDDIRVASEPACQAPYAPYASDMSLTGFTLNWGLAGQGFGSVPDSFHIRLLDESGAVVADFHQPYSPQNSHTFTGLTPDRSYRATIVSDCRAVNGSRSDSVELACRTYGLPRPMPFSENFDTLGSLPSGWYTHGAAFATTGLEGNSVTLSPRLTEYAYLLLPAIDTRTDAFELCFNLQRLTADKEIVYMAGYAGDPGDVLSSFIPVSQGTVPLDREWHSVCCNTALTADTTRPVMPCIIFVEGVDAQVGIDNIHVHAIPACVRPEGLVVQSLADTTATVAWQGSGSTVLQLTDLTDSAVVTLTAAQSPYTFTSLTAEHSYALTARTLCPAGDTSLLSDRLLFQTICATRRLPFAENFDDDIHCWQMGWLRRGSSRVAEPFTQDEYNTETGAGRSIEAVDQPMGTISYLSSPAINIPAGNAYDVSIRVERTDASYQSQTEAIELWANTVADDTLGGTLLGRIPRYMLSAPAEAQAGWHQYQFTIPEAGRQYIMVVWRSEYSTSMHFDDIEVIASPSCRAVTGIRLDGDTLSWTPQSRESQWQVSCSLTNRPDTVAIVSTPYMVLSGLEPGHRYELQARIRPICQPGDTAAATPFRTAFVTECGTLDSLPYICTFDAGQTTLDAKPLPLCWQRMDDGTAPQFLAPAVKAGILQGYIGKSSNYSENPVVLLPELSRNLQANALRLSFMARLTRMGNGDDRAAIVIGVMADPHDLNTFIAQDTIMLADYDYHKYTVSLARYTGTGRYVGISLPKAFAMKDVYVDIDNLCLEAIPQCADIAEGSARATAVTDQSITIALADTTALQGWSLAYGTAGTPLSSHTIIETSGPDHTITGLTARAEYEIRVRRACSAADKGLWSDPLVITTSGPAAALPWVCSFETAADTAGWSFALSPKATGNFSIGRAVSRDGQSSLYVSTDDGQSYSYGSGYNYDDGLALAYHAVNMPASLCRISFDWRATGGSASYNGDPQDFGYAMLSAADQPLNAGSGASLSRLTLPEHTALVPQGSKAMLMTQGDTAGWNHYEGYADLRSRPGVYNLVFLWNKSSYRATNDPLAIDNIRIETVECEYPAEIVLTDLTSQTAVLTFRQPEASQWQVELTSDGDTTIYNLAADSLALTGLEPNHEYSVRVRTICSDTSAWSPALGFITHCHISGVPYSEGFDLQNSDRCWTIISENGTIGRDLATRYTGAGSLRLDHATAVSPEFALDSLSRYILTGYVRAEQDSALINIGVITDPQDPTTFIPLQDILISRRDEWTAFSAGFALLDDEDYADYRYARHFVITSADNTLRFDNIELTACPRPDYTLNVTATGASLSTVAHYLVSSNSLFTDTVALGQGTDIAGLTPNQDYWLRAWAECSASEHSGAAIFSFHTPCGAVSQYPYDIDFEQYDNLTDNCWLLATSGDGYASTQVQLDYDTYDNYLSVYNGYDENIQTLVLPPLDNLTGKRFSMELTSSVSGRLGYLTDWTDFASFVALDSLPDNDKALDYGFDLTAIPASARLALRFTGKGSARIDNIHINTAIRQTTSDTVCFGQSYSNPALNIEAPVQAPGTYSFISSEPATADGQADRLTELRLTVLAEALRLVHDTVCPGTAYTGYGLNLARPSTNRYYSQSLTARGCDSTVVVELVVLPESETRFDTICQGDSYLFNGRQLTRAGVYVDTLVSSLGCSSVVTLHLSVYAAQDTIRESICEGSFYHFDGQNLSRSGIYTARTVNARGCDLTTVLLLDVIPADSVINATFCAGGQLFVVDTVITTPGSWQLERYNQAGCYTLYHITATELQPAQGNVYDDICQGRLYNGYGYTGLAISQDTVLTVTTRTDAGCDSITLVNITFHATQASEEWVNIRPGESYEWHNQSYNRAGDYTTTVADRFGCDSVLTLHLTVGDAVDNIPAGRMTIAPNPQAPGREVLIFTEGLGQVDRIEVINSYGALVESIEPHSTPLTLSAPQTPGIYHIRLITHDGRISIDKLIVR